MQSVFKTIALFSDEPVGHRLSYRINMTTDTKVNERRRVSFEGDQMWGHIVDVICTFIKSSVSTSPAAVMGSNPSRWME